MGYVIEAKLDVEGTIRNPLGQTVKEQRLVLVQSKVCLSNCCWKNFGNVAVRAQILIPNEVHGSGTARRELARIAVRLGDCGFYFILVIMRSVGKVGKTHGMVIVATVRLDKVVGLAYLQADRRVCGVPAFLKVKVAYSKRKIDKRRCHSKEFKRDDVYRGWASITRT